MLFFSKKGKKKLNFSVGKNAYRDWTIFFVFIVLLSMIVLGFSYRVFENVQAGVVSSFSDSRPVGLENLDREALSSTVKKYSDKEAAFEKLKITKPFFSDPAH